MSLSARRWEIILTVARLGIIIGVLAWFVFQPEYTVREKNERAVYRTLLTDMRYWGKSLLINDTTSTYFDPRPAEEFFEAYPESPRPPGSRYEGFRETYPALQPETVEDAEAVDHQSQPFPSDIWLYFLARYELLPSEEIDQGKHNVYLSFSNVGFNPDYSQAIVFVFFSCGGFCGGGNVYFLEKVEGRWVVITYDTVMYI